MAIDRVINIPLTKEQERLAYIQINRAFGQDMTLQGFYDLRRMDATDKAYAIKPYIRQVTRQYQAVKNDTQTVATKSLTLTQWLQMGEQFFDSWAALDPALPSD